jgi:hypothetical protein
VLGLRYGPATAAGPLLATAVAAGERLTPFEPGDLMLQTHLAWAQAMCGWAMFTTVPRLLACGAYMTARLRHCAT